MCCLSYADRLEKAENFESAVLPALLVVIGRIAFYPFIPRTVEMEKERAENTKAMSASSPIWYSGDL